MWSDKSLTLRKCWKVRAVMMTSEEGEGGPTNPRAYLERRALRTEVAAPWGVVRCVVGGKVKEKSQPFRPH